MSEFHGNLELRLLHLEDLKINSDCLTYRISRWLKNEGIFHQCRIGYVEDIKTKTYILGHCWVELEEGWFIDLTLRKCLVDQDDISHGVFRLMDYPRIHYWGSPLPDLDTNDFDISELLNDHCRTIPI